MQLYKNLSKFTVLICLVFLFQSCSNGFFKKVDTRQTPVNAQDRAKQNVETGKGISIGNVFKRGTNYEFSTSNPMWRASLEILDFLPLTTVDYSGGIIITDWYTDSNSINDESLKITIRFLSNEIKTDSIKIIIHQKKCNSNNKCSTTEIKSKIKEELLRSILTKASTIEKETKKN